MGKPKQEIRKPPIISFVVVNYNGGKYLRNCLSSIKSQAVEAECIVVDNGSWDNSREVIKEFNVKAVFNKRNRGYPEGVNQGLKRARGSYIFLLTPTTYLQEDAGCRMIKAGREGNIGVVAPKIVDNGGNVIHSIRAIPTSLSFIWELFGGSRLFPRIQFFRPWKLPHFDYSKRGEVEQPMSCALLIKKEVIEEVGFFDTIFFLYFSDVDFSKRVLKKYRIFYLPDAVAIHKRGGITQSLGPKQILFFHRDLIQYLKKHHPVALYFLGMPIIAVGEIRYLFVKILQFFQKT
ncbi:MAG: glycosyltransferase family 2 protein [candidate division WOR-3 bacterium]|nr:glycosyltransferase family 2 protein [candidate division WOR-3 bacterium]